MDMLKNNFAMSVQSVAYTQSISSSRVFDTSNIYEMWWDDKTFHLKSDLSSRATRESDMGSTWHHITSLQDYYFAQQQLHNPEPLCDVGYLEFSLEIYNSIPSTTQ